MARVRHVAFDGRAPAQAADAPLMAAIFSDHVVLQRDRPIEVWGQARRGEQVTVTCRARRARRSADATGRWAVALPALPRGRAAPADRAHRDRAAERDDVLVGDVWLCSGQSNMELAVRNALNAIGKSQHSANDGIRHVTIPRDAAVAPRARFCETRSNGKWPGPTTTQDFSAVCYYFARELQKTHVDVPQGLIHVLLGRHAHRDLAVASRRCASSAATTPSSTCWPNTPRNPRQRVGALGRALAEVVDARSRRPAALQPWAAGRRHAAQWQPRARPSSRMGELGRAGAGRIRRHDVVSRAREAHRRAGEAGGEACRWASSTTSTWCGSTASRSAAASAKASASTTCRPKLLKAGDNVIVVNVFDMWGSGGMHGPADQRALRFADGSAAPLAGWEYQMPPAGLVAHAARAVGADRRHQHPLQRHDRAARQVTACAAWPGTRARPMPGSTTRSATRRSCRCCSPTGAGSSNSRCRSSWCSSRTGTSWRPRR